MSPYLVRYDPTLADANISKNVKKIYKSKRSSAESPQMFGLHFGTHIEPFCNTV